MRDWDKCPMCGGEIELLMKYGASMTFSSYDDYYQSCTECSWDETKRHDFDIGERKV